MPPKAEFRHRAREVSRLEAFSDVIFGFCISLLVVSLEAPKNYQEMLEVLRGFVPFAICFFLFIDIWFEHHHFFRRYALQDFRIVALNTTLLFVILFYVYPLKFMFTMFAEGIGGHRSNLPWQAYRTLFTIYGLGFAAVFFLLGAMYAHAYGKRRELELDEVEALMTQESVYDNFATGAFGLVSMAIAWTPLLPLAGPVYFLIFIPKTIIPTVFARKRRRTASGLTPQAPGPRAPEQSPGNAD
jgi:uncharacterized membrane protein